MQGGPSLGYGRAVKKRCIPFLCALMFGATPGMASSNQGLTPLGNPSEIVAAESALAHLARDKGANTALVVTAEESAEVLGSTRSPVRAWLKGHVAAGWFADRQTGNVWTSCDGTAGVSAGLWQGGLFTMVWKRQKKLDFKWLLADAGALSVMPPAPDWVTGKVADCPPRDDAGATIRPNAPPLDAPAGADSRDGRSDDGSLVWRSTVTPDGSHALHVWIWQDGALHAVIDRVTPAGAG